MQPLKTTKKKNLRKLALATLLWTLSSALVVFGAEFLWDGNPTYSILAILLNIVLGIIMILTNRRWLLDSDELEKKIQLESMALTLGLTLVMGLAYSMLDVTDVIASDAEISFLVMFMGIFYLFAISFNSMKYK